MAKNRYKSEVSGVAPALLLKNPVLIELVGICPVAAAAVSLRSGLVLALVYWMVLFFTQTFASLLLRKVVRWVRVAVYLLLGLAIVLPAGALLEKYMPDLRIAVGIYIPLLAVNSLTALRCEKEGVRRDFVYGFIDSLVVGFDYGLVLVGVGFIREIFGSGKVFGHKLPYIIPSQALLMPFGGFLVLGFLAATLKVFTMKLYPSYAKRMSVDIVATPVTMKLQEKPDTDKSLSESDTVEDTEPSQKLDLEKLISAGYELAPFADLEEDKVFYDDLNAPTEKSDEQEQ